MNLVQKKVSFIELLAQVNLIVIEMRPKKSNRIPKELNN